MKQMCAFFFFFFPVLRGADGTQVDWKTKGYDSGLVSAWRSALQCTADWSWVSCLGVGPFYYSGENNALATGDNAAYCLSPFPHIGMQKNARMHSGLMRFVLFLFCYPCMYSKWQNLIIITFVGWEKNVLSGCKVYKDLVILPIVGSTRFRC